MNNQTHHRKSENCDSKSDFSSYHENLKNIETAWENLFQRVYLVNQYPDLLSIQKLKRLQTKNVARL